MANQSKLKAWVRYDGTGRVISGGPIFQVNKPKVGNWKQIDANLCCNSVPTTTTTTTAGGGVTPTAWVGYLSTSTYNSCNEIGGSTTVLYTSTPTIEIGTFFYVDAALTQVYPGTLSPFKIGTSAYSIYGFGQGPLIGSVSYIWNCNNFPITTSTTTTQAPTLSFIGRGGATSNDACNGSNETFYTTGPLEYGIYPQSGNVIYFDQALTQLVTYSYISNPGISVVFNCNNGVLSNQLSCG